MTVYNTVSHITHLSSARILNWLLATPGPVFIHSFIESLHDLATKQVMNSQGAKVPKGKIFISPLCPSQQVLTPTQTTVISFLPLPVLPDSLFRAPWETEWPCLDGGCLTINASVLLPALRTPQTYTTPSIAPTRTFFILCGCNK